LAIRAVVFDIGGVLEVAADGAEPTVALPEMIARWEKRLHLRPGKLDEQLGRVWSAGSLGTCSEEDVPRRLRELIGMSQAQADAFMREFWEIYLGELNVELAAYFSGLRPRYRTALLSNSFIGARSREEERYHFAEMTDLIIYSHEEGMAKPERRIYELTCERLGVQPVETVFLDDAEPSVTAACELGIHAILFRETTQAIAGVQACLEAHASA